jgi:hypothetical protein
MPWTILFLLRNAVPGIVLRKADLFILKHPIMAGMLDLSVSITTTNTGMRRGLYRLLKISADQSLQHFL